MELAELIKRVEGLTGADQEVDEAILRHIAGGPDANVKYMPVTASVDAVIQLIGEKLPGWKGSVDFGWAPREAATLFCPGSATADFSVHGATTPALALLLAFLRAWEARGEKG